MKKIRVFSADADAQHVERLYNSIARHPRLEWVGSAGNGRQALQEIGAAMPDVVITDLQLPGLDGMTLIKDISKSLNAPVIIACTAFYSDVCVMRASRCGASYFIYKPVDYRRIPEIIIEIYDAAHASSRRSMRDGGEAARIDRLSAVRSVLSQIGIPTKLSGAMYLVESILQLDNNATLMRNLSKGLYAKIAENMHTTPSRVERSLRNAIAIAYDRSDGALPFDHRPSNKEFIEYLYEFVESSE